MSKRSAQRRPFRHKARSPRVRRVTFAPSTRRIYARSIRSAFGLQVCWPPRPPRGRLVCGSCSSGRSFACSFLPASPHEATVAVQLGVPGTQGPQGTLTPKSLPAQLSPCGCQRQSRRCAPCLAHQQKALRRRQEKESPTAETPQGIVVHDRSLLSRYLSSFYIGASRGQRVQNRGGGALVGGPSLPGRFAHFPRFVHL
jgi:hypothetical protein